MTPVWQHETTGEVVGPDTIARMGEAGYVRLVPVTTLRAEIEAIRAATAKSRTRPSGRFVFEMVLSALDAIAQPLWGTLQPQVGAERPTTSPASLAAPTPLSSGLPPDVEDRAVFAMLDAFCAHANEGDHIIQDTVRYMLYAALYAMGDGK